MNKPVRRLVDKEHLEALVSSGDFPAIRELLKPLRDFQIATLLSKCSHASQAFLFRSVGKKSSGRIFSQLDLKHQKELIHSFSDDQVHQSLIAVSIGISLVGVVMWGSLSGSLILLIIKQTGGDPAVSSAPFVATLVGVTGLVIYFAIAAVVLRG